MSTESQSTEPQSTNRRSFIQKSAAFVLFTPVVGMFSTLLRRPAHAQGDLQMVKPSEPQAQALGYVEDATKVDVKKWTKKAGPDGAKQFCWNCQFYIVKPGTDPKTTKAAPCTIFANRGVAGQGWCNSWVKHPNVKI